MIQESCFIYKTSLAAHPEFRMLQTAHPVVVLPSPSWFWVLFPFHISFKAESHISNSKLQFQSKHFKIKEIPHPSSVYNTPFSKSPR